MAEAVFHPVRIVRSHVLALLRDDVDTDQILPARFMTTTRREGLGNALFHDWRNGADGPNDHALNRLDPATHRILVAGRNFGSGSSREHAPWALIDFGFRAIIAPSIADIFRGNAVQNGLLPIVQPEKVCSTLAATVGEVVVDLVACRISIPSKRLSFPFAVEPFARKCLLEGRDALSWILNRRGLIEDHERDHVV